MNSIIRLNLHLFGDIFKRFGIILQISHSKFILRCIYKSLGSKTVGRAHKGHSKADKLYLL